ncbi:hypothetical protein HK101_000837 [Irineochytrium annulatum]|nr:hypothetical protein HK101_000837 [Irineochytrium annulatum]
MDGSAAALAIELYTRTASSTVAGLGPKTLSGHRTLLYIFIAVILPIINSAIIYPFHKGTGAHFYPDAFCDFHVQPLALALIYFPIVVALALTGSFFTVYAIITYARRRSAILALLADDDDHGSQTRRTTHGAATISATTATPPSRSGASAALARAVRSLNLVELTTRARSTADDLLRALLRMALYAVVYHAATLYAVRSNIVGVASGGRDGVKSAGSFFYVALASSIGLFLCFGTVSQKKIVFGATMC